MSDRSSLAGARRELVVFYELANDAGAPEVARLAGTIKRCPRS